MYVFVDWATPAVACHVICSIVRECSNVLSICSLNPGFVVKYVQEMLSTFCQGSELSSPTQAQSLVDILPVSLRDIIPSHHNAQDAATSTADCTDQSIALC